MGLDISVYTDIQLADQEICERIAAAEEPWDMAYNEGYNLFFVNPDFPGRAEGIEDRKPYKIGGDRWGFRAGSYSGYNAWREWLAQEVAGIKDIFEFWNEEFTEEIIASVPFAELIAFSDCEGTLAGPTCERLAADFDKFEEAAEAKAKSRGADGEWLMEKYRDWQRAFHDAAENNGAVVLH